MKPGERTDKCRGMRHDCKRDGCFEEKYRCQLGKLDHLFPGNNGMSDIDGFCALQDVNGHILFLEWKKGGNVAQMNALLRLSYKGLAMLAFGDPKQMLPYKWLAFWAGQKIRECDGGDAAVEFDLFVKRWAYWAEKAPSNETREWLIAYAKGCRENYGEEIPECLTP